MKKRIFVLAAVLIGSQLHAQQTDSLLNEIELSRVVVTATKFPQKQWGTGKVITVITRFQLEKNSGKTLAELLNMVAGTTILGANNNAGTNLTASIRGSSSGNVLILIDGIPLNDPSVNTNYFDLNLLSIDDIEHIEILKGGQSTLYGSDAVAGVINIISRKATPGKINIHGSASAGSYSAFRQNIGISKKAKSVEFSLGYTHRDAKGFSAAYDSTGINNYDKDGIDQHSVNGKLGIRINPNLQATLLSSYDYYKTDLDAAAFTDEKDYTVKNMNLREAIGFIYTRDKSVLHVNYHFNYVQRDYLDDSMFQSSPFTKFSEARYIGRTHYVEAFEYWKGEHWELLAGADARFNSTWQRYFSTGAFGPYAPPLLKAKMNQLSPYGSVILKSGKGFTTELGGRWNHHSKYGSNFTFTFNPSVLIKNKTKIFINLYSAFKAPTLYQLFDPFAGNAELIPEKGMIVEGGLDLFTAKSFHGRLVGFYRDTKDAIVYTFDPNSFASQYKNASRQQNYGFEVETFYKAGRVNASLNYTYTDGKTRSPYDGTGTPIGKDTSYYNLYRIPKHALNLDLGVQVCSSFYTSVKLRSVSKRQEFQYGTIPELLKGYAVLDWYGAYYLTKKINIFLDLKNITDKKYFDFLGYNARRFNFTTGINFQL
jgi:vitamin B12 transporter